MNIELTKTEYVYLVTNSFFPINLKILFQKISKQNGDVYFLQLTEDQSNEIRDLCGEQLQLVGFDEHYNPTKEGELLEALIDKLFCG